MANVKILGNSMTIASEVKASLWEKVQKYAIETTVSKNSGGDPVFRAVYNPNSIGSFNSIGITFNSVNDAGYPYCTSLIPDDIQHTKQEWAVELGPMLRQIELIEEAILDKEHELVERAQSISEKIEIIG